MMRSNFRAGNVMASLPGSAASQKRLVSRSRTRNNVGTTNKKELLSKAPAVLPRVIKVNRDPFSIQARKAGDLQSKVPTARAQTATPGRQRKKKSNAKKPTATYDATPLAKSVDKTNEENLKSFLRTRRTLHDTVVTKFGSVRAMFKAFDTVGTGHVSFEQFQTCVKQYDLPISDADQSLVYHWVDDDNSNSIEFSEFRKVFEPAKIASQFKDCGNINAALKQRVPLELTPRSKRHVETCKDSLVDALVARQDRDTIAHETNTKLLFHAFTHMDENGDGNLSHQQLRDALGSPVLNLKIDPQELDYMIDKADADKDGYVSYKEFIRYFARNSKDLCEDIIGEGRAQSMAILKQKIEDGDKRRSEMMTKKVLKRPVTVPSAATTNEEDEDNLPPDHRPQRVLSSKITRQYDDRRPNTCGANVFNDRDLILGRHDRYFRKKREVTDWTRVGYGGDGVSRNSGMYQSSSERFLTTTKDQHSLGSYETLSGVVQADSRLKKVQSCTKLKRKQLVTDRINAFAEKSRVDALVRDNDVLLSKTKQRYNYLVRVQDEAASTSSSDRPSRKPIGSVQFHRMWSGSLESQFNTAHAL